MKSSRSVWTWVTTITIGISLVAYWMIYRARRKSDRPLISMEKAREHMKTGDLILFSGRYIHADAPIRMIKRALFLSATYVYRALDACEWGHVGVVYKHPESGELYLLHCEMKGGDSDLFAGEPVQGVQVTPLEPKLQNYKGYSMWRPLNRPIDNDKVHEFLLSTYSMGYRVPSDIWIRFVDRLTGAKNRFNPPADKEVSRQGGMLCSEWVGLLLEHCGVFDSASSPYKGYYLMSDFTTRRCRRFLNSPEWDYTADGYELEL